MIGKEILNYTIVSLIGKGGMGTVYLAENKYIKQQKVAIKVINGNIINDFTRSRLAEEADRLARLNHPNIVHFLNYHIDESGSVYLIMEYADGYSLDEYIRNVSGLIVEEKICSFFEPLLSAFDYAHKHKIIHKDIKPSNIIITKEGTPKILDFGISSLLDDDGKDKEENMIMGTPSYMSPEQVKGEALDQRSDIYSLGVLLHQMMTGNPPYDTTTMTEHEIYKHVVEEELPRMKTYYKYVSDKVQKIVDKATNKNKALRYQNCLEFKKALHNAIYPGSIPKGMKIMFGAVAAVLIAGIFFIWDYNRVKITYYKDYAEKWSIPQGIGKISSSDAKHMHRMYRFESKNYKLQRVSHVNSLGIVIRDGESERYDRPIDVMFFYNDENQLRRANVMDQNGRVLYVKSYNERSKSDKYKQTVVFQYNDEYGTEKTIGGETVGYVDPFASNDNKSKISRYLLEYDENGYIKLIRYAGFQNVRVSDKNGIYGKQYLRDEKGRVIEEMYLSHDGTPKATGWGLGKKLFYYDENDNWTKSVYQTVDGKPALDAKDGTAVCENTYDEYGNILAQYFKTADGHLMIAGMYECAGSITAYDSKGFTIKMSSIGIDGKIEANINTGGAAVVEYQCNEYGFAALTVFKDAEGNAILNSDGYASLKSLTDSKGNELESWYLDLNNKLILTSKGFAGVKNEYNPAGQVVKTVYYGSDEKPCETNDGYAAVTYDYNAMGDCIKISYLDSNLQPAVDNTLNVSSLVFEKDLRGNTTKLLFYDKGGKLTLSKLGIAVVVYKYDDNGNEVCRQFFDKSNKVTKGYIGFAKRTFAYDDNGHIVNESYFDEKDNLVLVDGKAGTNYKRDARGNIIESYAIGVDHKIAKNQLVARYKYDDNDNIVEYALFAADGKPKTNSLGYHKYIQRFNNRNQCVEICYYDTRGNLTPLSDYNYCIERYEYNEQGLQVKCSYFDKESKPVIYQSKNNGQYASMIVEYDVYGRMKRQLYIGKDGKPTDPKVMVPEGLIEYDKRGNIIYIASCDGKGNLIKNPHTGWACLRREYDKHDNLLWESYFDEKNNPVLSKDGFHKQQYKYGDNGKRSEVEFFGKNGKPIDVSGIYSKVVFLYDANNAVSERKYYSAAGKLVYHERYSNGSWNQVGNSAPKAAVAASTGNWQKEVSDLASELPFDLGEENDHLVIRTVKIVGSSRVEIELSTPLSKYEMSSTMTNKYMDLTASLAEFFKKELKIPGKVTVLGILKDSKGRELYRTSK